MQEPNKKNIPDFQSIMLPLLRLLEDGNPKSLNTVMEELTQHFQLSQEEIKIKVPSGQMGLFRNRVGWSRSYLKKAGLIIYPQRGTYKITEFGKKFLANNPKELRIKQLKKMPEYKEWVKTFNQDSDPIEEKNIETNSATDTPEEILATTIESLKKQLASDLLDKLKENSFTYFENFVIELLHKMGYGNFREDAKQITGMTGDDGIDGVISQDRLGLENVYIQAKRFTDNSVGSADIRNFIGSLALKGVNKGVFLTTSRFSKSAIKTAQDSKQQKIILIDGQQLANLAIEYNLGVQTQKTIEIKKIDIDYFEE